jgi:hypothetical protein
MNRSLDEYPDGWVAAVSKPPPRVARRVRSQPAFWSAVVTMLAGLGLLIVFWPVGLALIVAALAMDRVQWICGDCGNRIQRTSKICPTCEARLVKRLKR